jgi:CheY-like chemotaxis protein
VGTPSDRLRVSFEASSLRLAVELAGELRTMGRGTVQVRPAPRRLLTRRRWDVTLTAAPAPPALARKLERELRELARMRPGCRFVDAGAARAAANRLRAPVRVLIVDDSAPFRRAARELLRRRGYVVVGEAASAAGAIEAAERLEPDAVLLDVHLPDGCGFELSDLLTQARPGLAVLLSSADDPADCEVRVKACGARGFVPKCCLAATPLERFWRAP